MFLKYPYLNTMDDVKLQFKEKFMVRYEDDYLIIHPNDSDESEDIHQFNVIYNEEDKGYNYDIELAEPIDAMIVLKSYDNKGRFPTKIQTEVELKMDYLGEDIDYCITIPSNTKVSFHDNESEMYITKVSLCCYLCTTSEVYEKSESKVDLFFKRNNINTKEELLKYF